MAYTFEQILAADESNPQLVATNGGVTIFAPGDPNRTPLAITTVDGLPLANPVQVNSQGYGPAFMHATLDRVAWSSGTFSGYFTSYDGMKQVAVAARDAAELSAAEAASAAVTLVEQKLAAGEFQGAPGKDGPPGPGGISGTSLAPDPTNPMFFLVLAGSTLNPDPQRPLIFNVGA